jgi:hypothetical protein
MTKVSRRQALTEACALSRGNVITIERSRPPRPGLAEKAFNLIHREAPLPSANRLKGANSPAVPADLSDYEPSALKALSRELSCQFWMTNARCRALDQFEPAPPSLLRRIPPPEYQTITTFGSRFRYQSLCAPSRPVQINKGT